MASYGYSDYVSCPALQDALTNQFEFNPQTLQDPLGLLQFVNSEVNTSNTLQMQIAPGGGKLRTVQLVYQPRFTDASSDSAAINCNGGPEYGNTSTNYELDPTVGKSRPLTISPDQIAYMCENDEAWVAKQIQAHMDAIERDIDNELAAFVVANKGQFYGTPAVTNKNTQTKNSQDLFVPTLIGDVAYEFQQTERPGAAFVFGNGEINKYWAEKSAGCCAASGIQIDQYAGQFPQVYVRDKYLSTVFGSDDKFLVIAAGTVQMLKYLKFESPINRADAEFFKQGVLVNPRSGIAYDYYAKLDCGVWNMQISLAYKFVMPPLDQFNVNDPLYGTNGILQFTVVNP